MYINLIDICNPKQWKTIATKELIADGKYCVYGANGIVGKYNEYNHENETLLIGCRGTCGIINISKPKSYINGNAMCLDNLDEEQFRLKYLYYYFKNYNFNDIISGSTVPQITIQGLNKVKVKVLSLKEQDKIIKQLEKTDTLISIKKEELNNYDKLIKSQFFEMFKNSESAVEKLGNNCIKITDGTHKTPNYIQDGITFISAKNIINEKLDFSDVKYISCEEYKEIQKRCNTEKGDILLSKSGSLGAPVILDTDVPVGLFESLAVIKYDRNKLNGIFLCEQLKSDKVQKQFRSESKGIAIKHLHLNVLKNIDIVVPSLELQNKFAKLVEQINKQKDQCKESLKKLEEMQSALMQEYFG